MDHLEEDTIDSLEDHNGVGLADVDTLSTNSNPHVDRENGETDEEDQPEPTFLNEDLQAGYKILTGLMAWSLKHVNWPFMESIEATDPELYESYKLRIKRPMWLKQSKMIMQVL